MKNKIQSDIRLSSGELCPELIPVYEDIKKTLETIYKSNSGKASYDVIHLLICDESFNQRTMSIALEA